MNSNLEDERLFNNTDSSHLRRDPKESFLDSHLKTSNQGVPDLNSSTQDLKGQKKTGKNNQKLNYFAKIYLYKGLMTFHLIVFSIAGVLPLYYWIYLSQKIDLIMAFWALIQFKVAFLGVQERKLMEIERALGLMKVYLVLLGFSMVSKMFKPRLRRFEVYGYYFYFDSEIVVETLFKMIAHGILNILPVIKISKMFQEEGVKIDNSLKEFNSWRFVGFKNWVLIWLYWNFLDLILFLREGRIFKRADRMIYDFDFLSLVVTKLILSALNCGFLYLLSEGIEKKHLSKVQAAIQLIGLGIVAQILFFAVKIMRSDKEFQEDYVWLKFLLFDLLVCYVVFLYGAIKVRKILKSQMDAKQTL